MHLYLDGLTDETGAGDERKQRAWEGDSGRTRAHVTSRQCCCCCVWPRGESSSPDAHVPQGTCFFSAHLGPLGSAPLVFVVVFITVPVVYRTLLIEIRTAAIMIYAK